MEHGAWSREQGAGAGSRSRGEGHGPISSEPTVLAMNGRSETNPAAVRSKSRDLRYFGSSVSNTHEHLKEDPQCCY